LGQALRGSEQHLLVVDGDCLQIFQLGFALAALEDACGSPVGEMAAIRPLSGFGLRRVTASKLAGSIVGRYDDQRIRYCRWPTHVGASENHNRGMAHAQYEWVQVLCADDRLLPECLERIAATISRAIQTGYANVIFDFERADALATVHASWTTSGCATADATGTGTTRGPTKRSKAANARHKAP
jgi:hypothetical protein